MFVGAEVDRLALIAHLDDRLQTRLYNPPAKKIRPSVLSLMTWAATDLRGLNQRMHNKLFIADDRIAIVGGRNIADEYFDEDPRSNFLDLDVVVDGPVVADMSASFDTYWESPFTVPLAAMKDVRAARPRDAATWPEPVALGIEPLVRHYDAALQNGEDDLQWYAVERIAFWSDEPGKPEGNPDPRSIAVRLVSLLDQTEQDLVAQSPYLVLSDRAISMFRYLHERGVRVRVSTNSLSATDSWLSYAHTMRQRRMMISDLGFEIYEMRAFPADLKHYMPDYERLRARARGESVDAPSGEPGDPKLAIHTKCLVLRKGRSVQDRARYERGEQLGGCAEAKTSADPGAAVSDGRGERSRPCHDDSRYLVAAAHVSV